MLKRTSTERAAGLRPEDDDRSTEELVEYFIGSFTREGDTVFDPFAGFGTTLLVSERMGRAAWGVELDEGRAGHARSRLDDPSRMIVGDARRLSSLALPPFDLLFTSPPFMAQEETRNTLAPFSKTGGGYGAYLEGLRCIFAEARSMMKPGARAVIEVANIKTEKGVTTLAWDIGAAVSEVLEFQGEIVICHEEPLFGYDHGYCLVFTGRP